MWGEWVGGEKKVIKGLRVRVRHVNLVIKIDRTRSRTASSRR